MFVAVISHFVFKISILLHVNKYVYFV